MARWHLFVSPLLATCLLQARRAKACADFNGAVLDAFSGLYPIPKNWPQSCICLKNDSRYSKLTYRCLQLSPSTPMVVRDFITRTIEELCFSDVHAMLRLPLPENGITAGQNFAITQVLMAVISGVSITLYDNVGGSGPLFMDVVEKFFPWDEEPSNDVKPKAAACIIYELFRNPLTHAAGIFTKMRNKGRKTTYHFVQKKSYVVKVIRGLPRDKTTGDMEE